MIARKRALALPALAVAAGEAQATVFAAGGAIAQSKASADALIQHKVLFAQGIERASLSGEPPEAFAQLPQRDRALCERLGTEARLKIE